MEDFGVGNNCDIDLCGINDYLNYKCLACNKNLCKQHYHNEYNCPFNKDSTYSNKQFDLENEKVCKMITDMEYIICDFCKKKELKHKGTVVCEFCLGSFCFNHRIESSHECKKDGKVGKKQQAQLKKIKFKERLNELKQNK